VGAADALSLAGFRPMTRVLRRIRKEIMMDSVTVFTKDENDIISGQVELDRGWLSLDLYPVKSGSGYLVVHAPTGIRIGTAKVQHVEDSGDTYYRVEIGNGAFRHHLKGALFADRFDGTFRMVLSEFEQDQKVA
jgi:uncharacterized protein (DUF736 family)